ncbi:MAG: hypothetical protein HOL51_02930 [Gemmatimonadetes bacterium]|nr:hypothetical protein [Gemmatimonadota bacterium]
MGFTAEAIAGLDFALWDLLGKYRQEPVWRLLGGAYRQTLPVYSSGIPGDTSEKQVQQLEGILAHGFTTAKCGSSNGSLQMQMGSHTPAFQGHERPRHPALRRHPLRPLPTRAGQCRVVRRRADPRRRFRLRPVCASRWARPSATATPPAIAC